MSDLDSLLARAKRAFGGRTPSEVASGYRAIVGPTRSEDIHVQEALEALQSGRKPTPLQLASLEHAIRVFRPAILSSARSLRMAPEHMAAFPGWEPFCAAVRPHLYAVGRIDRGPEAPGSVPDSVGTGFLVAPHALVTNRHVLEVLSLGAMELERGMGVVRFGQERGVPDSEGAVPILSVLGVHPTLDLALFEIEPRATADGREPFAVHPAPPEVGETVVAVGYPFADAERNPLFVDTLFEGVYGVKRASPGEVIGLGREVIHHDCSTLGGSSGSPLLDMSTARVLGVHARGGFAVRNTAVAGAALAGFIEHFT